MPGAHISFTFPFMFCLFLCLHITNYIFISHTGDASIQDLLSNTSIHRLHAVISESVSIMNEDQSHVSISLNEDGMSLRTQSIPNNSEAHSNGEVHSRILEPTTSEQQEHEEDVRKPFYVTLADGCYTCICLSVCLWVSAHNF